jgi:hypothetical protein
MKKPSGKKQLEHLAALPDEAIDLSEIPERLGPVLPSDQAKRDDACRCGCARVVQNEFWEVPISNESGLA